MRSPALVNFTDQAGRARCLVIRLDPWAAIPLFEQVRAQLFVMVAFGHLPPGCWLPTVRDPGPANLTEPRHHRSGLPRALTRWVA